MRPGDYWLRRFGYTEHGNSRARPVRPPKGWPDGRSCSNVPLENLCLSDRVRGPVEWCALRRWLRGQPWSRKASRLPKRAD